MQAGDERLGERKTWLHDDYVKFIRLAQWLVEEAGCGIVGFVTNHGYLSNATFRLMRHELLRVFPEIRLVDLHGNRKSGGSSSRHPTRTCLASTRGWRSRFCQRPPLDDAPTRQSAENVGTIRRWNTPRYGARAESKLAALDVCIADGQAACSTSVLAFDSLAPAGPQWSLVPGSAESHPEYAAGWSLAEAMPVNTSTPVTARDHFPGRLLA